MRDESKHQHTEEEVLKQKNEQTPQEQEIVEQGIEIEIEGEEQTSETPEEEMIFGNKSAKAIEKLTKELEEVIKERDALKDQNVRLQAEFMNFRKRNEKEKVQIIAFANEDLVKKLLPVIDNFERTLEAIEKTDNLSAIKEGIELVSSNLKKNFAKAGIEPIESIGKEFNSSIHEAITSIPVEEDEKKGIVVDEVEKGYMLKEKVIRFSKVIVGE